MLQGGQGHSKKCSAPVPCPVRNAPSEWMSKGHDTTDTKAPKGWEGLSECNMEKYNTPRVVYNTVLHRKTCERNSPRVVLCHPEEFLSFLKRHGQAQTWIFVLYSLSWQMHSVARGARMLHYFMMEKISIYLLLLFWKKLIKLLEIVVDMCLSCKNEMDITVGGMRKALRSPHAQFIPSFGH